MLPAGLALLHPLLSLRRAVCRAVTSDPQRLARQLIMWLLRATPTPRSDRPHWRAPALLAHWGRAAGALAQMGRHIAGWGGKCRDEALAPAFRVALGVRHRLHSLLVGVLRRPLCIVSVSDTVGCDIPCRPLIRTGRGRGAWRLERGEGWLRKLVERWVRSSRNRWIKLQHNQRCYISLTSTPRHAAPCRATPRRTMLHHAAP